MFAGVLQSHLDLQWCVMQKKENLTLVDDHVLLVEYLEEHPLLLSRPGDSRALLQLLQFGHIRSEACACRYEIHQQKHMLGHEIACWSAVVHVLGHPLHATDVT